MLITNTERQRVQLFIENKVGCNSVSELKKFKNAILSYNIEYRDLEYLVDLTKSDSISLFNKGRVSFFEAIKCLENGSESWAVVKFYYATYYFLRAELLHAKFALIRCNQVYYLEIKAGKSPVKAYKRAAQNDHKSTLGLYKKIFEDTDITLSNSIDSVSPYDWLCSMREWANYKSADFIEKDGKSFFYSFVSLDIQEQIDMFLNDNIPTHCFDADFACLALPVKRAQLTWTKFKPLINNEQSQQDHSWFDGFMSQLNISSNIPILR